MTYSLLAFDPETNCIGSVVASYWFAVGSCVPYFRPGVGVVHVQNRTNPILAGNILNNLECGSPIEEAVARALDEDNAPQKRQILAATFNGELYCTSGSDYEGVCHDCKGQHCVAAGNIISGAEVVNDMIKAFQANDRESFIERLFLSLEAGEYAGGDSRGKESAALKLYYASYPNTTILPINLRVDNHEEPLPELRRLYSCYLRRSRPII